VMTKEEVLEELKVMNKEITRREFITKSGSAVRGSMLGAMVIDNAVNYSGSQRGPYDFLIVEGHRDIWEFNDRFGTGRKSQNSPLRDYLLPRLLEGGVDVVIMPAGGESVPERGGTERLFEGSMRIVDMLLTEIEKTNGKASIITKKVDIPNDPDRNNVKFFLDLEGGASIEIDPEPAYHVDRRLALLRNFYRLGVRGMQLTHHGRNQLADGWWEGKYSGKLSRFGVEVVQEMNKLGMMIGVSHLSATGIFHVAEITTQPIVSTHTNMQPFVNTDRQHNDDEVKAIASTGGIVGIRYMSERTTPYTLLADEIDHIVKLVGIEHTAVGWLGRDKGHPYTGEVPGVTRNARVLSMYEHWNNFIRILYERGYKDEQIALILGGNYLRIWNEILKE